MNQWSSKRHGKGQGQESSSGDEEKSCQGLFRGMSTKLQARLWGSGKENGGGTDTFGFQDWIDCSAKHPDKDNGQGPLWQREMSFGN